jgi:hypothetical protein
MDAQKRADTNNSPPQGGGYPINNNTNNSKEHCHETGTHRSLYPPLLRSNRSCATFAELTIMRGLPKIERLTRGPGGDRRCGTERRDGPVKHEVIQARPNSGEEEKHHGGQTEPSVYQGSNPNSNAVLNPQQSKKQEPSKYQE